MKNEYHFKKKKKWLDDSNGRTKVGFASPCHVLLVNGVQIYGERCKR
jgi:hypothetical protein